MVGKCGPWFFSELHSAIQAQNLELLERAVDLVESKRYTDKLGPELREAKDLIARLRRLQKLIHEVTICLFIYKYKICVGEGRKLYGKRENAETTVGEGAPLEEIWYTV